MAHSRVLYYSNLTCTCFALKCIMTYMYITLIRSCSPFAKGGMSEKSGESEGHPYIMQVRGTKFCE